MALVNDVLRDLERRDGAPAPGALRAPRRAKRRVPLGAVAVVLGTAIVCFAFSRSPFAPSLAEATGAITAVAAPPPVTAPVPAIEGPLMSFREPLDAVAVEPTPADREPAADPVPGWVATPPRPTDPLAERALAVARRDETAALPLLERALSQDPMDVAVRVALTGALLRNDRSADARAVVTRGLALAPDSVALAEIDAQFLLADGRLDEARVRLQDLLASRGDDPPLVAFLAAVELRAGRADRAADLYRRALRGSPGQAAWWMGLGLALEQGKSFREARVAFETALATPGLGAHPQRFVRDRVRVLAARRVP